MLMLRRLLLSLKRQRQIALDVKQAQICFFESRLYA